MYILTFEVGLMGIATIERMECAQPPQRPRLWSPYGI